MKKILLLAAALCGMTLFAVDPVAVWNGDFNTTTKGDYTLSANGNTVAANGSSITISGEKGVSIIKTAGGNIGDQASTVIIKYTNFTPPTNSDAQVLVMNHTANTSYKDFIGAASITGGNIHGIWQNTTWGANKTTSGAYGSAATDTKTFAFTWAQTGTAGAYFWMDGKDKTGWSGLHGNLQIDGIWVGGPNESTTLKTATGMKVLAIAVFDSRISDAEIAAYEFPNVSKKVEPIALINFGYTTEEIGWYNYTQNRGNTIPSNGTLITNGVSFVATNTVGNFFNSTDGEFDEVTSDWEEGTYEDIFGNNFTTVVDELRSSLGVDDLLFSVNVYKSALMNGGYSEHSVSISGLDGSSKYVVYTGFGMRRTNYPAQVMGVQFDASGYASVEALEYITTVDGMATTKANRYQSFTAGTQLRPGCEGLLLTRLTNVQPKVDGTISFTFKGDKGGINFLAVAKVNETVTYTTAEIDGGSETSVTAINEALTDTNDKAEVTLSAGATVYVDTTPAVPTKLICVGSITLSATEKPDLTNLDLSGVTGGIVRTWLTAEEKKGIGFNFASARGPVVTAALVADTKWYSNNDSNNGSNIAMSDDGLTTITWTSANTYDDDASTHGNNSSASLVRGYLDDANGVSITVKNIPFAEYAVIIYASTDDPNNPKLTHKVVNGENYTYDSTCTDVAKVGTDAWGQGRSSSTVAYGTNAFRVIAQTKGTLTITSPKDTSVKARGCISAIQIVPYSTFVAPTVTIATVATQCSEDYASNTITGTIADYVAHSWEGELTARVVVNSTAYSAAIKDNAFTIEVSGLEQATVYRTVLEVGYTDGETFKAIATKAIALYQGERQYTWMASPIVLKEATTVNDSQGSTVVIPTDMPDYVENCDSVFTVSISASEAVDAANDMESLKGVQGGVRIAEVDGNLKLQVVKNGDWTDFSAAEIDKTYTMTVTFHYVKDENDIEPAVSYVLDKTTVTGDNNTSKLKVTEVFVADGTVLPANLTGLFQFDSAVVVDIELKPGDNDYIDFNSEKAALDAVDKLKIGICDAVSKVLTTEDAQAAYRAYFHLVVVQSPSGEGLYAVMPEFTEKTKGEIEEELKTALSEVVNAFNSGSAEIVGKPGLYYGVKRGDSLDSLSVQDDLQMADADGKVTISITKPDTSKSHFYRIIVSPTPAEPK